MTFKRTSLGASVCIAGIVLYGIVLVFLICVMLFLIDRSDWPLMSIMLALGAAEIVAFILCLIYFNANFLISSEGMTLKCKLTGVKSLRWDECRFIGIFGFNYGMDGMLIFSKTPYSCQTQQECRKISKKKDILLRIAYTPELFAEMEKYAPPHLIANLKRLLEQGSHNRGG